MKDLLRDLRDGIDGREKGDPDYALAFDADANATIITPPCATQTTRR